MADQINLEVTSYEGVVTVMKTLTGFVKRLPEFRVSDAVKVPWTEAAVAFEKGDETAAVKAGLDAVKALQNIFGAFLRYAVLAKKDGETERERPGGLTKLVNDRDESLYDEDIVAGLRKKLGELEAAVRAETNGTFEQRIEAYLAVRAGLNAADEAQAKLDKKRLANAANFSFTPKEGGEEPTRVQRRVAKLLADNKAKEDRRKAEADAKAKRAVIADEARAMFD